MTPGRTVAGGGREAPVDALKALALLAVFAVNLSGYGSLFSSGNILPPPMPRDAWWAQGLVFLIAALLLGKGLGLLSFLFGYGQAMSARARGVLARAVRKRRLLRLLGLGLLHGVFVYMGDILTLYALCGLWMLGWGRQRLGQLRRRLCRLAWISVTLLGLLAALLLSAVVQDLPMVEAPPMPPPSHWLAWWVENASGYALTTMLSTLLMAWPLLTLMTAGLIAGRLRLLSHPRWRPWLRTLARRWLPPGLLLNLGLAALQLWALGQGHEVLQWLAFTLSPISSALLLLGLVPALVLAWQGGRRGAVALLAPAGRISLSLYLGSSLLGLALLSGVGLGWQPSTAQVCLLALGYWISGLALAHWLRRRGTLPPLERWLARRVSQPAGSSA